MRRDLVYYYPLPVEPVYEAFVQAATQKFGKNCKLVPCKNMTFGLNFSLKYNMNGGSLTLHFMPYQNGTAIDLRYSIVQLMGARYKAHARDLILFTDSVLRIPGQMMTLDINIFLSYESSAPAATAEQLASMPMTSMQLGVNRQPAAPIQPVTPAAPVQPEPFVQPQNDAPPSGQQTPQYRFCMNCGAPITPNSLFCTKCGKRLQ